MTKYIIDATNGTILNMNDCYIVDAELLGDDIMLSDSEAQQLANEHGISVAKMARDTGFGDNAYRYTVSYSPLSLRDEANLLIDGGIFTEEDEQHWALRWAGENAEIEELAQIAEGIMQWDSVWDDYKTNFISELVTYYKNRQEGK